MPVRLFVIAIAICIHCPAFGKPELTYVHPSPGSKAHPVETGLICRFNIPPHDISNLHSFIEMSDGSGHRIDGRTRLSSDRKTIFFRPSQFLQEKDTITVRITPALQGASSAFLDSTFHFTTRSNVPFSPVASIRDFTGSTRSENELPVLSSAEDPVVINGISLPSDYPAFTISVNSHADTNALFFGTINAPLYKLILDPSGAPIWYNKQGTCFDFKCHSNGLITYFDDAIPIDGGFVVMDSTYTIIDTISAPAGYKTDNHEVILLPNGHSLVIGERVISSNDLPVIPDADYIIKENSVIELDADNQPVFYWHVRDHYSLEDAIHVDLSQPAIDYAHLNALAVDLDGNYLVSSRHLNAIIKIDSETGEIIWQLGGVRDQFQWTNQADQFSYQHDIRVLPNGHYTVFDNGVYHVPPYSRGLELSVEPAQKTVTKIWEYRNKPDIRSGIMGNMQTLSSGNRMICWGTRGSPLISEVNWEGEKVFELSLNDGGSTYRAHRSPWHGRAIKPYLIAELAIDRLTLIFNKFGDADVAYYNIYAGQQPQPEDVIATSEQPFIHLSEELENDAVYYFRVTAVNSQGIESAFSNEESVHYLVMQSGVNFVKNGDFSDDTHSWFLTQQANASGSFFVNDSEELHITIENMGAESSQLAVRQFNLPLIRERSYRLEFDAYAASGRILEANLTHSESPYTNYSRLGLIWLDGRIAHFSRQFTMTDPTDTRAALVFGVGTSQEDVFFDNISLVMLGNSSAVQDRTCQNPEHFSIIPNYPNPFNPTTTLRFNLSEKNRVTIRAYDCLGRMVECIRNESYGAGEHQIRWDAAGYAAGIYFVRFESSGFVKTQKVLLIK